MKFIITKLINILKSFIIILNSCIVKLESKLKKSNKTTQEEKVVASVKYGEKVDWSISKDSELKPNEKYYLIELINNINLGNNCAELSYNQLMEIFNCKRKSYVVDKIKDLEKKGAIRILVGNSREKNKYIILKHIKLDDSIENRGQTVTQKETSDSFVTTEIKDISNEGKSEYIQQEIAIDIIKNNIEHYSYGLKINQDYLKKISFDKLIKK